MAVLYAREGADVAISYLREEQPDAEETKRGVEAEGRRCVLIPGDLKRSKFCDRLVEKALAEFGKLDILVSNAAHQNRKKTLDKLDDEELETTFQVNILAYIRLCRAALKHMKPGAAIIGTSSETGIMGSKELPDYSATKGAMNAFTKSLAQNVLERGIMRDAPAPTRSFDARL